ncbi:MAG: winged helix-turn-helix transcriptional regulator [Thermoleophilaceae bacterium]|nr:winged helix-turn-helix transcriptional regulator [Thermoleophilaceae bacterium]
MATDYLSEARSALEEQLKALREQEGRLERALAELGGAAPRRRGPGRPRGSKNGSGSSTPRRRRRRSGGTRAEQALELVRQNPGMTIPELADRMGIKQNYLYRVMGGLESEGAVKKDGRGFSAT